MKPNLFLNKKGIPLKLIYKRQLKPFDIYGLDRHKNNPLKGKDIVKRSKLKPRFSKRGIKRMIHMATKYGFIIIESNNKK